MVFDFHVKLYQSEFFVIFTRFPECLEMAFIIFVNGGTDGK